MASDFTLRQVRYFVAVAEAGTLSAAAQRLYVSQPTLSAAITELEASLGVQLCIRQKSRGVELTPNGLSFYEQARQLVRDADELAWNTKTAGGRLRGPLTIGSYHSLAPEFIPYALTEFPKLQPDVMLNYVEGSVGEMAEMLARGELDIALLYDYDIDVQLRRRQLFEKHLSVLLPADHRLAARDGVDLADLVDEPFIHLSVPPGSVHINRLFSALGLEPNVRYHSSNSDLAYRLVSAHLGYALLPSYQSRAEQYRELGIVHKPIVPASRLTAIPIVAAWSPSIELNLRAKAFLDFLVDRPLPSGMLDVAPA